MKINSYCVLMRDKKKKTTKGLILIHMASEWLISSHFFTGPPPSSFFPSHFSPGKSERFLFYDQKENHFMPLPTPLPCLLACSFTIMCEGQVGQLDSPIEPLYSVTSRTQSHPPFNVSFHSVTLLSPPLTAKTFPLILQLTLQQTLSNSSVLARVHEPSPPPVPVLVQILTVLSCDADAM